MIDLPKNTKNQDNKTAATKALALTRKADKVLAESNITKHAILSGIYGMSQQTSELMELDIGRTMKSSKVITDLEARLKSLQEDHDMQVDKHKKYTLRIKIASLNARKDCLIAQNRTKFDDLSVKIANQIKQKFQIPKT